MAEGIDATFCRNLYNSIVSEIRKAVPGFKSREYWVWSDGSGRFEVQGPNKFYWYGSASNKWDAKFNAFCKLAEMLSIDYESETE